jgi:hypothetical protein
MEKFVIWWCSLIGVTNDQAINIAVGIVAAGILFAIPGFALGFIRGLARSLHAR